MEFNRKLAIERFGRLLKNLVQLRLGVGYTVVLKEVSRNNEKATAALVISEANDAVGKVFFVEDFYDFPTEDVTAIEKIVEGIASQVQKAVLPKSSTTIESFEDMKEKLYFRLINYEQNKTRLVNVPHKRILDLALEVVICFYSTAINTATLGVNYDLLKTWGISKDQLFKQALISTQKNAPVSVRGLGETCEELEGKPEEQRTTEDPVKILTNKQTKWGASVIAYPKVLDNVAELLDSDSLLLIPSSIHEFLIMSDNGELEYKYLKNTVEHINNTQLEKEDILSYNIYRYNRNSQNLSIVNTEEE